MTVVIDLFNTLRLALLVAPDIFADIKRFRGIDQQIRPVGEVLRRLRVVDNILVPGKSDGVVADKGALAFKLDVGFISATKRVSARH